MNRRTILVATDFSADAELAVEQARSHARLTNASLLLVHVLHVPTRSDGEGMLHDGAFGDSPASDEQRLKDIVASIDDVDCTYQLLRGDPADEILQAAEKAAASLVVVGTKGRTGLARVLLGSVAEKVVRRASCSVLVVKR